MYNSIQVEPSHHQNNEVPQFFRNIWKEKNGQDPLENYNQYCRCSSKTEKLGLSAIVSTGITLFLALARMPSDHRYPWLNYSVHWLWIPGVITAIMIITWFVCDTSAPENPERWHHQPYFDQVQALFSIFDIKPSSEVGSMSEEEFHKAIVDSLKVQGRIVDSKQGFARLAAMTVFKEKHTAALKWDLCDKKYDQYFPKKEAVEKK